MRNSGGIVVHRPYLSVICQLVIVTEGRGVVAIVPVDLKRWLVAVIMRCKGDTKSELIVNIAALGGDVNYIDKARQGSVVCIKDEEPDYIFPGITKGEVNIICGDGGVGKTNMAAEMVKSLIGVTPCYALGETDEEFARSPRAQQGPQKAVYITAENKYAQRFAAPLLETGLTDVEIDKYFRSVCDDICPDMQPDLTPEYKLAGNRGEQTIVRVIESVLREGDHLLTNVSIEFDGKPAELDNVVINKYGVFIIEVKNYAGYIVGNENDYEWEKYKLTAAGNIFEKKVKNPIKQVKRQVYILAHYLDYYGLRVWVRGYAVLLQNNSPVNSDYILHSIDEIDKAIHTRDRTMLKTDTVYKIVNLLSWKQ